MSYLTSSFHPETDHLIEVKTGLKTIISDPDLYAMIRSYRYFKSLNYDFGYATFTRRRLVNRRWKIRVLKFEDNIFTFKNNKQVEFKDMRDKCDYCTLKSCQSCIFDLDNPYRKEHNVKQ